ncbi:RHS repeat domain-containing protein, partial [Bergeyella zoohelcum]|uniref:RHS repeat domain-containing protein n=2 Tax=Bergeyella zoohelcum TaxID=1015 RepID=UPI003735DC29
MHKDYLGSILAISDEVGNKVEQRHYDAWGNLTHLQYGNGEIITDKELIANSELQLQLLIARGYTSHEHLFEVGLIHMNGRLYDPLLRRFLNADEHIQAPYNTQNYNKYGYVYNNPLMYNDPSGEFIFTALAAWLGSKFLAAVVIGAAIGVASYTVGLAVTGNLHQWSLGGALKSAFWGAVSGAMTFGIGNLFSVAKDGVQVATQFAKNLGELGTAFVQSGLHAVGQGVLSVMQGGSFEQAFWSGALGSLGASAFGAIAGDFASSAGGTIAFGALSGGIGAELSGGNFWEGAVIGGIVAG